MTPVAPRVSVLLPCYDGEQYLEEALQSLADQTFTDFEIIFTNDGSRDSSLRIAREFARKDSRMTVLDKENGGIVSALNAGLALCRGTYVARMDADDVSFPDRFASQVAYLDQHPGCVVVGGFAVNDQDKVDSAIQSTGRLHSRTNLRVFPPTVAFALHPLIMMRREAVVTVGGYRTGFTHAEDYDLYIRLRAFGTIDNPRKYVLFYRRHEKAVSIQHLESQEMAATTAEYDAMRCDGIPVPERWLSEPYLRLRIWRRYQDGAPQKARIMQGRILADLLSLRMRALFSYRYFTLRLRILAAMLRWVAPSFRSGASS
jgi:glycosyltransferase involved in cell wall biosynthesis